MNLISFKGRTSIIRGLAAWFLSPSPEPPPVPEPLASRLDELAAGRIDPGVLRRVAGFLSAQGVPPAAVGRILAEEPDRLLRLARDVEAVDRRLADGSIAGVRVIEEEED